jgi:two-component system, OmpR family, response regulator
MPTIGIFGESPVHPLTSLTEAGYQILIMDKLETLESFLNKKQIDLILIYLQSYEQIRHLCENIIKYFFVPIIVLVDENCEEERIKLFECGVDDYLSIPYNTRELIARVALRLRKTQALFYLLETRPVTAYVFSDWKLQVNTRYLVSPDKKQISLTLKEYHLLTLFLETPYQIFTRDLLIEQLRQRVAGPFDRSVDIQISRLRKKIEKDSKNPTLIKTIRGGGYLLASEVQKFSQFI